MTRTESDYAAALEKVEAINAARHRRKHPLWITLLNGELNRPQVAEFLRQFSVIPLYNHLFHGPLYVNCPSPKWRARMAEVVYEEGTGSLYSDGVPHWQLFLRLGEAFGIPSGVVVDTHVARLSQRLGFTKHDDPVRIERDLMDLIDRDDWIFAGIGVIFHGRRVCEARQPQCDACTLNDICPSTTTPNRPARSPFLGTRAARA